MTAWSCAEHLCPAAITSPTYRQTSTPVPPGIAYTIAVWAEHGGEIELRLAAIDPPSVALAAFVAACLEWPTDEITRRDRARIVRKRERPPGPARRLRVPSPEG